MTVALDAEGRERDIAARKWLSQAIYLEMGVPLFPYMEREIREIGRHWYSVSNVYLFNGVGAALIILGMWFRYLDRDQIEDGIEVIVGLIAICNFAGYWDLKERMKNASKLDHAFFRTVSSGETDLSLWPSFIAGRDNVETALSIAKEAVDRPGRKENPSS